MLHVWCSLQHVCYNDVAYVLWQVESVQLASESAQRQAELEVANAKHNAAQAAAAHKSAAASWQGELDWQKSEVCPLLPFCLSASCLAGCNRQTRSLA